MNNNALLFDFKREKKQSVGWEGMKRGGGLGELAFVFINLECKKKIIIIKSVEEYCNW